MADGERRRDVISNVLYGQATFRTLCICNTFPHYSRNHRFVYTLYVSWDIVFAINTVLAASIDPPSISV